jgi:hypothetical protein
MLDIGCWILEEEGGNGCHIIQHQASSIRDFKVLLPENRSLI